MIDLDERVRPLEGISNLRDYGGYPARGGTIKLGRFFRSGQHGGATPDDLAAIGGLDFQTVIDLRGDTERATHPCLRPDGFCGTVLFADGETAGSELAPHEQAARGAEDGADIVEKMILLYRNMPFRPPLIVALKHYFDALEHRDGASLVHCAAGKDRTGLAVALFHLLLGVDRDMAFADYMLTNEAADIDRRLPLIADDIRARYGQNLTNDAIRTILGVDARYLETALASIEQRHGSVAAYAENVLAVTPARVEAIRERSVA